MGIRNKIIGILMTAGMSIGVGVMGATPANAAAHFTPVCYYKKVTEKSGLLGSKTYYNVVKEQHSLSYPTRTKMCHVVQTQDWFKWPDEHDKKVIYDGWIQVRY